MRELNGRVAVVTGSARGIGRALAERFAHEGMKIVLADAVEASLRTTVAEMRADGADAIGVVTDVTDPVAVDDSARAAIEAFGAVHLVCNNAGISVGASRCWEVDLDHWRWVLDVNLHGVFHGIRTFTPILLAQGVGHIVNTASMSGLRSVPGMSTYCVSKAGVVALSETLYHEIRATGVDVGVSLLCPAATNTEGWRRAYSGVGSMVSRHDAGEDPGETDMQVEGISQVDTPATVAEAALRAVIEDRFYVFTQPAMKESVRIRTEHIMAELPGASRDQDAEPILTARPYQCE